MSARRLARSLVASLALAAAGCRGHAQLAPVDHVDLQRFMGDWYVIAHVPSRPERSAVNAIEGYRLAEDGTIETTFRYREGSVDAPVKTMRPRGFVRAGSGNAVWGMQFIWPIRAEYVIAYVDPDYQQTIVARSARDYAWIMARTPTIPGADYARLLTRLEGLGYAPSRVRRVPQQWPEPRDDQRSSTAR